MFSVFFKTKTKGTKHSLRVFLFLLIFQIQNKTQFLKNYNQTGPKVHYSWRKIAKAKKSLGIWRISQHYCKGLLSLSRRILFHATFACPTTRPTIIPMFFHNTWPACNCLTKLRTNNRINFCLLQETHEKTHPTLPCLSPSSQSTLPWLRFELGMKLRYSILGYHHSLASIPNSGNKSPLHNLRRQIFVPLIG